MYLNVYAVDRVLHDIAPSLRALLRKETGPPISLPSDLYAVEDDIRAVSTEEGLDPPYAMHLYVACERRVKWGRIRVTHSPLSDCSRHTAVSGKSGESIS